MRTVFGLTVGLAFVVAAGCAIGSEVWIGQGTNGSALSGTGTQSDPFLVAPDSATDFDSVIDGISPDTTVHLGAGLFLTNGSRADDVTGFLNDNKYAAGTKLLGAGSGVTTIQLSSSAVGSGERATVVDFANSSPTEKRHCVVRDLTINCNFSSQAPQSVKVNGISYSGFTATIENVEIIGLGGRYGEAFGIIGGTYEQNDVALPSFVTIRGVTVHQPYPGTDGFMTAIHPAGNNKWTGTIESCFVDLSATNYPGNGAQGIAFAGSAHHLVVANNTVRGCTRGFHVDTPGSYAPADPHDVVVKSNTFQRCNVGIAVGWPNETLDGTYYRNFLIEGNSMELIGTGIDLCNRCTGFQIRNNVIVSPPDTPAGAYCHAVALDNNCAGNVISGTRYGPPELGIQVPMKPASYAPTSAPAMANEYFDNDWIGVANGPKVLTGYRFPQPGNSLPTGTGYWAMTLGASQADSNPSSEIFSTDYDKQSNYYPYIRMGRNNYNPSGAYNVELDPSGASGVWVGTQSTGNLGVGGWAQANTGTYFPQGARIVRIEGGTAPLAGLVTLGASGQATVATTAVRANSRVFLTVQQVSGTAGFVRVQSRVVGTSFLIKSSSTADRSQVAWTMIDPSF